jgi:hypothetical protein
VADGPRRARLEVGREPPGLAGRDQRGLDAEAAGVVEVGA